MLGTSCDPIWMLVEPCTRGTEHWPEQLSLKLADSMVPPGPTGPGDLNTTSDAPASHDAYQQQCREQQKVAFMLYH